MAKPSGACDAGNHELKLTALHASEYHKIWVIFKIPEMPAEWSDDGNSGTYPKITVEYQVTNSDASVTMYINSHLSSALLANYIDNEDTIGQVLTPTWQGNIEADNYPVVHDCDNYPSIPKPKFTVAELRVKGDSATYDSAEINSIKIKTAWDKTSTEQVERTNRSTALSQIYLYDYPVSAWHVKNLLIETYNTYLYNSIPWFSIPLNGEFVIIS